MDIVEKIQYQNEIDSVIAQGPYCADWDSLGQFQPPAWLRNGKFGIFIHWGAYSVPAFGSEWYPRNMYIHGSPEYEHHIKTYGPHKQFGYKDFIPLFKAEQFRPEEWADLFAEAGAQYVVPVAEHHDGFQMYKSAISHWNAAEMGPKRDVLGQLFAACEARGIVTAASSHRAEHWFFMGHGKEFDSDICEPLTPEDLYWPAMPEADHHDLFSGPAPTNDYLTDWLLRTCELVDNYRPRMVYFDWWIQHSAFKPVLKKFAAFYYNRGVEWGLDVAIAYKHDAFMFGTALVDIERGKFADIQPFFWQTDTAVAKNSWCYTENNQYKSAASLVCDLVDIVSKNGTLLLNIGPKADGSIPKEDADILRSIGAWLKVNGEAIYGTSIWRTAAEGPTKTPEGQFTDATETLYTPQDIRFTLKGGYLYATVLQCPKDGRVLIKSLAQQDASHLPVFHGIIRDIAVLGNTNSAVRWHRTAEGLSIQVDDLHSDMPVVFKISID